MPYKCTNYGIPDKLACGSHREVTPAKVMTPDGLTEAFKILAGVLQYTIYYKLIQYMLYTIYNILQVNTIYVIIYNIQYITS